MLRPRSSFTALGFAFVVSGIAFAGCNEADLAPPTTTPDAGSTTTREPNEPVAKPDAGDDPSEEDEAAAPEVDSIVPNKAPVGAVGPSIVVTGNNFVPRSIVQLDGAPLATTFVSGTELRATIPSGKLSAVGTLRISVGTAPPGGGASKEVLFSVENPEPTLTALAPLSVLAGAGDTKLEVSGSSFLADSKIVFGTTDLITTVNGRTKLEATIPAALLVTSQSVPVTVVNPEPGGGSSKALSFLISNPSGAVQSVVPSTAFVGGAAFEMTVNGSGFVNGSKVVFNGTSLPTTFVGKGSLKAQVASSFLAVPGDVAVAVENPPPGGGVSSPVGFKVQYPAPTVSAINPSTVGAGSVPTEVTVTGTRFFPATQVTFDNAPAATVFVDATHVKATLTAAQLSNAGSIAVRVVNPAPGGGSSAALPFLVTNGVPTIASLAPASVVMGAADTSITINGSRFVPGSSVKSNGQAVVSTYVSGTRLTAIIPSSHLLNPGSVALTVSNPAPGGGTSQPAYLSVGCDTSGVDVALGPVGTTSTVNVSFDATGLMPVWQDGGGSCQTVPFHPTDREPGRYVVVQNTAGVPVTLSAWADCSTITNGDAFLTFYRRPTIPATDTERLGCAFVVAEGINGQGGYASPESGGSLFCPGLTKANGGGLPLNACEKAVVHIQSYSHMSTSFPPPSRLRVRAD